MTGSSAGSIIGGVAGLLLAPTGFGAVGFAIGMSVGGMAGGMLFPPKGAHTTVTGPRLGDLSVQASSYGGPIPIIYGTFGQLAGNVIWATDIIETRHETTTHSGGGGKGGPPQQTQTSVDFTYSVSMAVAVAAGPIGGIKRMWANGKLVWNATDPVAGGPISGFRVYFGDETQVADATIEADKGVGNVPAYRGLAYCVFTDLQLAPFNNSVPNFTFELIGQGDPETHAAHTFATTAPYSFFPLIEPAIDTHTGLIWIPYVSSAGPGTTNLIYVIRPDTWAVVKIITSLQYEPRSIVYQPGYTYQLTNGELTTEQEVPARMWVGGANDDNLVSYIDTATYAMTQLSVELPALQTSDGMSIDLRPIGLNGIATSPVWVLFGGTVHLGTNPESGATSVYFTQLNKVDTTLGLSTTILHPSPVVPNATETGSVAGSYTSLGGLTISEGVSGTSGFYVIDVGGRIFKLDGSFNVSASYLSLADTSIIHATAYRITYNPDEDCVYTSTNNGGGGHSVLTKFDANLGVLWTRDFTTESRSLIDVKYQKGSGIVWATAKTGTIATIHAINPADGTDTQTLTSDVTAGVVGFGMPYPNADFMVFNSDITHTVKIPLTPVASGTVTLDDIVSDLSVRAGLTTGDITVSSLAGVLVDGFAVTTRTTVRAALEPLQRGYFFDVMESDNKVKFILRGSSSVVTIPSTEVAAYDEGSQPPDPLSQARVQEVDLPHQIEVSYPDSAADYRVVTQYSRRLIGSTQEKLAIPLPVACTGAHAILVANVLLYDAWTARTTYTLTLARKYAYLDPTDVIIFQDANGLQTTMRILKVDFSLPMLLKIEAVREDASVYSGFLFAAGVGDYVTTSITTPVPTQLHLLDIPILRDIDNDAGFYVAGNGYYTGWRGASVFRSIDAGASFTNYLNLTSEATIGSAASVLATTAKPEIWDDTHTVDVNLQTGSIATAVDNYAVYAGGNAVMIGSELVQFGTVTSLGSGVYRLSHLLRGRNGTEWAMTTHVLNEDCVFLTTGTEEVRVNPGLADVNLSRVYKGVAAGQYITDVPPKAFSNTGVGLKPYSPVHVAGTRDGSLNLTATWIRRTRISGSWADYIDVPLGEDSESYSIDVMNGSNVVRTLTSSTPTVAYSAANQTTDFGSTQSSITLKVYQVSAQIGRGYAATATV